MQIASMLSDGWPALLARLPTTFDLDATAKQHRALVRRRGVRDAASLLRLALGYGAFGMSLRVTAGWAGVAAVAELSDVALLNRLRGAAEWLGALVDALLARRLQVPAGLGRPLRLVDASIICGPQRRGVDWRLHVGYDPGRARFGTIELTEVTGGESLKRQAVAAGAIYVGDRGYAHAGGLRHVRDGGADFVVRIGWRQLKLRRPDGEAFDLLAALRALPGETGEFAVVVRDGLDPAYPGLSCRLIARRKPPQQAAEQRRRLIQRTREKTGRPPSAGSLAAAEWLIVLTSLPPSEAPEQVLEIYRLRWQIELAFKRLKSLGHIDRLPAKDKDLARSWLYANLIAALLLDQFAQDLLDSPPCAPAH
jgi:hypothetical protein